MGNRVIRGKERKDARNKLVRRIMAIVIPLVIIASASIAYFYLELNKVETVAISKNNSDLKISEKAEKLDTEITNIALFGVDKRSDDESGRSDSIMIMSIDRKHNKLKLSSIMRDTYVNVDGHNMTKINEAHSYGGDELSLKTLNQNFNMNIKDFITIDFRGMKGIVDTLGGVPIEIKDYEIPGMKSAGIETPGTYNLNGEQALTFSRIRYEGNGDYERTDRQRTLVEAIFQKIKSQGAGKFPAVVSQLLPFTKTSLTTENILKIGTYIFTSDIKTVDEERIPANSYSQGKTIDGVFYLVTDLKAATDQINSFIYDDKKPAAN